MSRSTRNPELGQLALDIPLTPAEVNLDSRNSFSKAVKPAFHGLSIEHYAELTPQQVAYVTPQLLEASLIDARRHAPNTIYYRNPETNVVSYVAVSPDEYQQLAGNITTLGNRVRSTVLHSRSSGLHRDTDLEAAIRGGVHAVNPKLEKMQRYRQNVLSVQFGETNWLAHASKSPGHAWKDGYNLRLLVTNFREFVLKDMLVSMSEAGDWSEEKTQGIQKVLEYQLFFNRANNQHIDTWQQLLGVSQRYLGHKTALFDEKIAKAKRYTTQHAK